MLRVAMHPHVMLLRAMRLRVILPRVTHRLAMPRPVMHPHVTHRRSCEPLFN
jgi:hypothetical protein